MEKMLNLDSPQTLIYFRDGISIMFRSKNLNKKIGDFTMVPV
jgi:hypothetical protein